MKRIFIAIVGLSLGGCALTEHCNSRSLRLEYEHISHPFAGPPFGPESEEDTLDHIGPVGRCQNEEGAYVEATLGYMWIENGFKGPRLTGGIRVGVELWKD